MVGEVAHRPYILCHYLEAGDDVVSCNHACRTLLQFFDGRQPGPASGDPAVDACDIVGELVEAAKAAIPMRAAICVGFMQTSTGEIYYPGGAPGMSPDRRSGVAGGRAHEPGKARNDPVPIRWCDLVNEVLTSRDVLRTKRPGGRRAR